MHRRDINVLPRPENPDQELDPPMEEEQEQPIPDRTDAGEFSCLFNNRGNLKPSLYSSLRHTVLPTLKLKQRPDSYAKQIVYRSLFKNCYSNIEDERFLKKLSIFHSHFEQLCDNVYPFTKLKQAFPNYLPQINTKLETKKAEIVAKRSVPVGSASVKVLPGPTLHSRHYSNLKRRQNGPKQLL